MMEMPMDVLNKRLGKIRDNGDIDFDNTQAAVDIDIELGEKFVIIPREEIADVEIDMKAEGFISAGTGPEKCSAGLSENPAWLFNHAVNCLALYQYLMDREKLAKEQERIERNRQIIINRRPEPGVYTLNTGTLMNYVVVVTADRRIIDLNRTVGTVGTADFTDIFDGMESKSQWRFTPINTGLSA